MAESVVEGSARETGWSDVTPPRIYCSHVYVCYFALHALVFIGTVSLLLGADSSASAVFSHCPFVFVVSYFPLCRLSDWPSGGSRRLCTRCSFNNLDFAGSDCFFFLIGKCIKQKFAPSNNIVCLGYIFLLLYFTFYFKIFVMMFFTTYFGLNF